MPDGVREEFCPVCSILGAIELPKAPPVVDEHLRHVGNYELLETVARGGMGVVYRARQINLGRIVAVKLMVAGHFAGEAARKRFHAEAGAAARLQHPNIVAIHEIGEHDGQPYFSMDFVEGRTLADLVRDRPLSALRAAGYVAVISHAIQHAHEQGVLHRDLKPANVIVDNFDQPRVTDFGLAKQMDLGAGLTLSGEALGSPAYMPPEQAGAHKADIGPRSDVYSLGAILYHLIASRPPFQGETPQAVLVQVERDEPISPRRLNPEVPVDLETICLKCLEKESARRYQSANALAADLERFSRGEPVLARPVSAVGRLWRWRRRNPALANLSAAVGLLLLAIAIGSTVAAFRIQRAQQIAVANLRASLIAQARATRLASGYNQRAETLRVLAQAATLGDKPEFRSAIRRETIAALALPDARFVPPPFAATQQDPTLALFDHSLALVAQSTFFGPITIHRLADGAEMFRLVTAELRVRWLIDFSADTRFLLVGCLEHYKINELTVWELATGRLCVALPVNSGHAVFSPDGQIVAIAVDDGGVKLFSLPSGEPLREWPPSSASVPAKPRVCFSPDGKRIAAATALNGGVEIRDVATGTLLNTVPYPDSITALAWSPDHEWLSIGDQSGRVAVWDLQANFFRFKAEGHTREVHALSFSSTEPLLASAAYTSDVQLWDLRKGRSWMSFPAEAFMLNFSADGHRLGTVFQNQRLGWIDFSPPAEFLAWRPPNARNAEPACAFSPDGRLLAHLDDQAILLSAPENGKQLATLPAPSVYGVAFHPSGEALVASGDSGVFRWQLRRSGGNLIEVDAPERLLPPDVWRGITFSQDGRLLAVANEKDKHVWIITNGRTNDLVRSGFHSVVYHVAFNPNGRQLASGSWFDEFVNVWDPGTGGLIHQLTTGNNRRVTFSPDGRWLATFFETCQLWQTDTWQPGPVLPLPGRNRLGGHAAFSPDSRTIAVVLEDRQIHLYSLPSAQPLAVLEGPGPLNGGQIAFSPDGARLAAAGPEGEIQMWNLRDLRQRLARTGLDWDAPALPPVAQESSSPLTVKVAGPTK